MPNAIGGSQAYDVVHWVDDTKAFAASIELFDAAVPVGASSGAAFVAARYEAQQAKNDVVVVILPDHARRYAKTIRSEQWRRQNNINIQSARKNPVQVDYPHQSDPSKPGVQPGWYRINWRSYYQNRRPPIQPK